MTRDEFAPFFEELTVWYGDRNDTVFDFWFKEFGSVCGETFKEALSFVKRTHRAFGADRWPVPQQVWQAITEYEQSRPPETLEIGPLRLEDAEYVRILNLMHELPQDKKLELLAEAKIIAALTYPSWFAELKTFGKICLQTAAVALYCKKHELEQPECCKEIIFPEETKQ